MPNANVDLERYRSALTAAHVRIAQLQRELALFEEDPSYEEVRVAEEKLDRARSGRARRERFLPKLLLGGIALTAAFALTHPALPPLVQTMGRGVSLLGASVALVTLIRLVHLLLEGPRPSRIVALERDVRRAKATVGLAHETHREGARIAVDPEEGAPEQVASEPDAIGESLHAFRT